ncbi:D-aminoacyl-tRNA deacylase [Halosolutus gelatinilyticus]|uniref:D-aminoacyl-tRNA deacylase n=1 Tax=Halosolutus gelatinilyticus TaxID=2931975 RepID=UPI001FF2B554|nr:D-aminoacyl-tRNA deacylase [Halosolutus gelatinilyticus]
MTLAIVESRADRASVHICDRLRELAEWEERRDETRPDGGGAYYRTEGAELRSFDDLHLDLESPADAFDCDPDLLVFASRHSGDTGPLLTGHFTGNVGPAEFGGDDNALAKAAPNALVALLEAFDEYAPEGYDVGVECTHHGPTEVGCPSLFAELGSDDAQWDDPAGAEAVARAVLDLRGVDPHRSRQVVGFGGSHYAPRFERIVRETPWAVGHVAADWSLDAMGHPESHRDVLDATFTASDADLTVIEGDRPALVETIEDLGYRVVSETWLREVGGRSLGLVDAIEADLGTVADGVRFGDRSIDSEDAVDAGEGGRERSFAVVDLPTELVDAAEGIDPDRVRSIVEDRAVAFETENGGSRVGSRAAIPNERDRNAIVEALAAVLEAKYETVRVEDDAVVAEAIGFDPALAADAGVPEGPKFGVLAAGESVTVDGKRIDPDDVHRERTDRFPR